MSSFSASKPVANETPASSFGPSGPSKHNKPPAAAHIISRRHAETVRRTTWHKRQNIITYCVNSNSTQRAVHHRLRFRQTRAHTTYCCTSTTHHETTYLGRRTRPAPVGERRHGHAQRRHIYRYQPPAPTAAPEPPAASMARAAGLGYSLRQRDRRYGTSSRRRRIMQYWDKSVRLR